MRAEERNEKGQTRPEYYGEKAGVARMEFWRFDLNKNHLRVVLVICDLSFGMARETVKIDRLRVFCNLTGLDRANVSKALDELIRMRIVGVRRIKDPDVLEYWIEPDSDNWRCKPLISTEKFMETVQWVEMLNAPSPEPTAEPEPTMPDLPADWHQ